MEMSTIERNSGGDSGNLNLATLPDEAAEKPYSDRIGRLRDNLLSSYFETDLERARYYTRAYKATEGQPPCMRSAKGLEETLRHMTIRIDPDAHLVGSKSAKRWGDPVYIEKTPDNLFILLATKFYRKEKTIEQVYPDGISGLSARFLKHVADISEEEFRELTEEIIPYWKKNSIETKLAARWAEENLAPNQTVNMLNDLVRSTPDTYLLTDLVPSHMSIGIKKVLKTGFRGIGQQAAEQLAKLKSDERNYERRKDFLESVQTAANAVCALAERYARLAEEVAQSAKAERRTELLEIADRCRRVPAEPPRTFMEALQAIWLTQVSIIISFGARSITGPGRIDQYLYPFYREDRAAGRITRKQALDAIEEYYILLATNVDFGPNNVTIGGVDSAGEDAVNEVSYLFLEAHEKLNGLKNGLAVRISEKAPRAFLLKACEVHRHTAGIAFYNDAVVMSDLLEDGYSLQAARDYSIVGCVETTGTGNNNGHTGGIAVLMVAILEMALNEGCRSVVGWQRMGVPTPPVSSMKTFEDVKDAFVAQLSHAVDLSVRRGDSRDQLLAESFPVPLVSSTIEGCIESGEDLTRGGARFNHACVASQSLATVSNSLGAIKWAVFDKKLLTLEDLVKHTRNNFEGAEAVRQQLLRAPKYGNDDLYADEIALWVADVYTREVRKHRFWMGGTHRSGMVSSVFHTREGAICGATPDGRLAGRPVANGVSPTNGTEQNGITAVLRSVAAISTVAMSNGTSLNITFNPMLIKSDEGLDKFASLVEGYFALGGRHVQFNPLSKEILLDAQNHPENHLDLTVKVTGFSFRFIDLPKEMQDDLVERTEFAGD